MFKTLSIKLASARRTVRSGLWSVRFTRNWYDPILYALHLRRSVILRLKNGLCFRYVPNAFNFEMMVEEPYKDAAVLGRDVLDVGAFNGDSMIYFAKKGARSVVGFEPYPFLFKLAEENLALNEIRNARIYNEGIGSRESVVLIDPGYVSTPTETIRDFGQGTPIQITTLERMVRRFNLSNAVLKMDCEGCESDVLRFASAGTLSAFSEIVVEYHGDPSEISATLCDVGFETEVLPKRNSRPDIGLIIARKQMQ